MSKSNSHTSAGGQDRGARKKTVRSIVSDRSARSTPAGLAIAEEAQALLAEANANTQAMIDTLGAIIRAETIEEIVRASLDTIRKEFGWTYASYWVVDPAEDALVFSLESGRVDDEFQRLTRTARFREGEGLNGRAWRLRDLVHVDDLGELHDCCRAPLARRAGVKTAIALPMMQDNKVVGTLDFFSTESVEISQARLDALRTIGRTASNKLSALARHGRPRPDQADGRQRADQPDVRRPRPEDPVHEPQGRGRRSSGWRPTCRSRSARWSATRSTSSTRRPSISAGCWPTPATSAHRDDQRRPRALRAERQRDDRPRTASSSDR